MFILGRICSPGSFTRSFPKCSRSRAFAWNFQSGPSSVPCDFGWLTVPRGCPNLLPPLPSPQQLLVVMDRIRSFPLSSPISKFLNGLEILLAKAQVRGFSPVFILVIVNWRDSLIIRGTGCDSLGWKRMSLLGFSDIGSDYCKWSHCLHGTHRGPASPVLKGGTQRPPVLRAQSARTSGLAFRRAACLHSSAPQSSHSLWSGWCFPDFQIRALDFGGVTWLTTGIQTQVSKPCAIALLEVCRVTRKNSKLDKLDVNSFWLVIGKSV